MKIVIKIIQNAKKEKADYQKETYQYLPMTAYQSLQKGRSKQRQPNSEGVPPDRPFTARQQTAELMKYELVLDHFLINFLKFADR